MSAGDISDLLRMLAALAFVLALMGGLSFTLRKMGLAGMHKTGGKARRLQIIENLNLDGRRKLVLIQRDDKQHLVILGPSGETVVETDIKPAPDHETTAL